MCSSLLHVGDAAKQLSLAAARPRTTSVSMLDQGHLFASLKKQDLDNATLQGPHIAAEHGSGRGFIALDTYKIPSHFSIHAESLTWCSL